MEPSPHSYTADMARARTFEHDRRSAKRFVVSLPVETSRGPGTTRDVSVSGLYLITEGPLAVGDHLELTMSVPDPDHPGATFPMQLVLHGSVVRVDQAEQAAGVGVALDEGSRYFALAS